MTPIESAAKQAEEALGCNLVWLADQLDLQIRQACPETKRRLAELRNAHIALCKAGAHTL